MKFLHYLFVLIFTGIFLPQTNAQLFKATLSNEGNELIISLRPFGGDMNNVGFSQVEMYLRTPSSSPAFDIESIEINSTDFPGNIPLSIASDNESGEYRVIRMGYANNGSSGASNSYTEGEDYEFARIQISNGEGVADFQLVHDPTTYASYLNLTSDDAGADLSFATCVAFGTCSGENVFYGAGAHFESGIHVVGVSDVALPIELSKFNVQPSAQCDKAMLEWMTSSEIDNQKFIIQRSDNGQEWTSVAEVAGQGSSSISHYYQWVDNRLPVDSKTIYYRLKQIDFDGEFTYSNIRTIYLDCNPKRIEVYPNPATTSFVINASTSGKYFIENTTGAIIKQGDFYDSTTVDVTGLPRGMYIIHFDTGETIAQKIIIE